MTKSTSVAIYITFIFLFGYSEYIEDVNAVPAAAAARKSCYEKCIEEGKAHKQCNIRCNYRYTR